MTKYNPSPPVVEQIDRVFTYHAPKEDQGERYTALRARAKDMALMIVENSPPGREQAVALTKLEECIMFANAAIARGEDQR